MTMPGARLRALAARFCSPTTMNRFVDPVIADLQLEHAHAIRAGRIWKSRWVRIAGAVACAKVFLLCGLFGTRHAWRNWNEDDARGLSRVVWHTVAVVVGLTAFLALPELLRLPNMALYLLPAVLPLSVPVALAIGTTLGVSPRSRRLIVAILLISAVTSAFSFANLGWLTPASNQLYREKFIGRPAARGYNELTLTELRQAINDPDTRYSGASSAYHTRLALAVAPLTFAMFSLVILTRRRVVCVGAIALAAFGYYVLSRLGSPHNTAGVLSELATWMPQIALLLTTFVVGALRTFTRTRV